MKRYSFWCPCHVSVKGNHAERREDEVGEFVLWEDVEKARQQIKRKVERFSEDEGINMDTDDCLKLIDEVLK